jgi:hypothetical protein
LPLLSTLKTSTRTCETTPSGRYDLNVRFEVCFTVLSTSVPISSTESSSSPLKRMAD